MVLHCPDVHGKVGSVLKSKTKQFGRYSGRNVLDGDGVRADGERAGDLVFGCVSAIGE